MAAVLTTRLALRGGHVAALRARPATSPAPAAVVVHDAWGLDEEAADLVAALANAGFTSLAPDLLGGRRADDAATAAALAAGLDAEHATLVLAGAVDALTTDPATASGRIAAVGVGMGAPLAAFLATVRPEIAVAVVVGPLPELPLEAWGRADARFVLLAPVGDGSGHASAEEPGADGWRTARGPAAEDARPDGSGDNPEDVAALAAAEEAATTLRSAGLVVEVHPLAASDDVAAAVADRLRATVAALG